MLGFTRHYKPITFTFIHMYVDILYTNERQFLCKHYMYVCFSHIYQSWSIKQYQTLKSKNTSLVTQRNDSLCNDINANVFGANW